MDLRIGLTAAAGAVACGALAASVELGEMTLPTYMFSDPDPVPKTSADCYPYFRFDQYAAKPTPKTWKTVTLESDRVRVVVTPEVGGKIWGAFDKRSGRDFIYFNRAAKFRNIAMRGPWASGGIEFNFGVIGHAPWTASPVDWFTRRNDDGSVSCFVAGDEYITQQGGRTPVKNNVP